MQQEGDLGWTKISHWPPVIWKTDSVLLSHILYVTITNYQRHKKRMLMVIHFSPSRSFFYRDFCQRHSKKTCVEPKQKYKQIAYRNAGNCPYSQYFGDTKLSPRLKFFSLMINPRLGDSKSACKWKSCRMLVGKWNITSLTEKEHELVAEAKRYSLDVVSISSTKPHGSNTVELDDG